MSLRRYWAHNYIRRSASNDRVKRYIEHHLSVLPANYWLQHFGTEKPDTQTILANLVWRDDIDADEFLGPILYRIWSLFFKTYDFTLPCAPDFTVLGKPDQFVSGVTDYVLAVHVVGPFPISIDMES